MSKCRICLCSKPRKHISELNIFENGERRTYKDIVLFCLGIQINDESTKLCVKCYRKIVQFYHFKILAVKSDDHLRLSTTGVLWMNEDIKLEKDSEKIYSDLDEPFLDLRKCEDLDTPVNEDSTDIKIECKSENNSDDEFLIVIKSLKSQSEDNNAKIENIETTNPIEGLNTDFTETESLKSQSVESKENAPVRKNRRKTKRVKKEITDPIELLMQKRRSKGVYEGICEHCGNHYKNLRAHVRMVHLQKNRKKVKCEHCDKTFMYNAHKRRHVQRRHLAIKQKCTVCDKSVLDLKMHMRALHDKDSLQFKCVQCDQKFITQSRLNLHLSVHTKARPFKCGQCESAFRLKLSLENHIRQVHNKEKSHLCQFCSKSFFKKYHLITHMRSHTNERPYECPDCGKHYQTSTTLKNHREIHSKERKFNCTLCDATFVSQRYVYAHMKSHVKEKRYPCNYCDVKFHRSDHRKRHEYTAHLKFTADLTNVPRSYTPKKRTTAGAKSRPKKIYDDSSSDSMQSLDDIAEST